MNKSIAFSILISLLLVGGATLVHAKERTFSYEIPDIRNDFCGVEIGHQNCKCAFHNEFCKSVGMNKEQAEVFVNTEFQKFVKVQILSFAQSCVNKDGRYDSDKRSCTVCEGGAWEGSRCVENAAPVTGPYNSDCRVNDEFVRDWKKYSDFDNRITVGQASFEVREYNSVLDEIATTIVEIENIEYQMEIDRVLRLEMKDYKKALVQNIRNNLTKSILRLSWLTYNTAKGAKGWSDSYGKIFTVDSNIEQIGAVMKFVQSGIPKGSKAEINTNARIGKIKSGAWNATLEVLESGGDPSAVATQVYKDSATALVGAPSLEFSDEELGILRDQHLANNALDELIADSYKENALRRREIAFKKKSIESLYVELQEWKQKEFERTRQGVEDQCKTGGR